MYDEADGFDIVFTDSLKSESYSNNRMFFVESLTNRRKIENKDEFFKSLISEFRVKFEYPVYEDVPISWK